MNLKYILLTIVLAATFVSAAVAEDQEKRPNFVWLISEDNSVHYHDLYFKKGASTPRISKLAEDGVVFNHAFSVAPVCSAARSMLATGCYGSRISTQFHRKAKPANLPKDVKPVYAVMRDAGYYTSNKKKTDYNFSWNGSNWHSQEDWRGREPNQPFFHKQSFGTTHEGKLQRDNQGEVTDDEFVSPRHPDTPLFRQAHRAYKSLITKMDAEIGAVVDELKKDGVLEDTFIFYFGDHGGVMPGSKGYAYETGLHVPLVIRIPENFKHLVDLKPGTRSDGFVEFIDFGATIMNLAGITPPSGIDGKPFMGPGISKKDLEERDEAFGLADRFDEKYDLVRTLRKGNLKYIRNFQPFNFDGLQNNYRYRMASYREWRELYKQGKLHELQAQFFETRSSEALYDVVKDPYETKNLATDPAYAGQLKDMRERLTTRLKSMPDLSMYPESHLLANAVEDPVAFGTKQKQAIGELIDIADLSLKPFAEAKPDIAKSLNSKNPWKRYWGLIVCSSFMEQAKEFIPLAKDLAARDENLLVRTRAAEFLGLIGAQDPQSVLLDVLSKSESDIETLLVLNT
ncbi:sulfatase, partial [bacterium E08(2017)]